MQYSISVISVFRCSMPMLLLASAIIIDRLSLPALSALAMEPRYLIESLPGFFLLATAGLEQVPRLVSSASFSEESQSCVSSNQLKPSFTRLEGEGGKQQHDAERVANLCPNQISQTGSPSSSISQGSFVHSSTLEF